MTQFGYRDESPSKRTARPVFETEEGGTDALAKAIKKLMGGVAEGMFPLGRVTHHPKKPGQKRGHFHF